MNAPKLVKKGTSLAPKPAPAPVKQGFAMPKDADKARRAWAKLFQTEVR